MPVYEEKIKDPKTGKLKTKLVGPEKRKQYFVRTYVTDEFGNKRQLTRHNKNWIGLEGKNMAQQEESYLKNNKIANIKRITLSELAEKYLEYKKPMIKFSTYLKYKTNIENHILVYLGNQIVSKLTTSNIVNWQNEINKLNLSIRTKRSVYTTFYSLIKFGCASYNIEKNVFSSVDNFKIPNGAKIKKMNILTLEEFEKFIQCEKNENYANFFTILFYAGLRRGELLALTKQDIDFENNMININKTYSPKFKKYGIEETSPKTESSNRKIKMIPIVRKTFENMSLPDIGRIFDNITLTTLKRRCDNNLKKIGITKKVRIHDFRHSFSSLCLDKEVPIGVLSEYLGHESISITLDTYSHLYPNSQMKLLGKFN